MMYNAFRGIIGRECFVYIDIEIMEKPLEKYN